MSITVKYHRPPTFGIDADGWIAIVTLRTGDEVVVYCQKESDWLWKARALDRNSGTLPSMDPLDPDVVFRELRNDAAITAALKSAVAA